MDNLVFPVLLRAARAYKTDLERRLTAAGVFSGQAAIISFLVENEGATQADICADLGVAAPTVSKSLKLLAEAGMVEMRPNPEDSRSSLVYTTEPSRSIVLAIESAKRESEKQFLDVLTPVEQLMLGQLVEKLSHAV